MRLVLTTSLWLMKLIMNIGIDISSVIYGTGVSIYTRELVRELVNLDAQSEYVLYGGSFRRKSELDSFINSLKAKNVISKTNNIPPTLADLLFNRLRLYSIESFAGKLDVFHSSDWTQPKSKAKKVTTIHDLVPVLYPELSNPKIVRTHKKRLELVKKEVDKIIVPSETTKKDLVKLGFDGKKIKVIVEAATPGFKKADRKSIEKTKKKLGIKGEFLLSVGVNPRKNTEKIIKSFKHGGFNKDFTLVLVGNPFGVGNINEEGVCVTGYVSDQDLSSLYTGASALIYPSIYEGFGIPILDAYSVGTPVVTSNLGSMKEVAGSASVLVDPSDVDSIASGIEKAIRNKSKLVVAGKKRVKEFSWKRMAEETLEVYNSFK